MGTAFTRTEVRRNVTDVPLYQYRADFLDVVVDCSRGASRYVRTHDTSAMLQDLNRVARRYPEVSIAAAAVLGFLLERVLFRKQ